VTRWLEHLARLANLRGRWIAGAWIVALIVGVPLAAHEASHLSSGGAAAPGSGSAQVNASLSQFPNYEGHALAILVSTAQESNTEPPLAYALARAVRAVHTVPGLSVAPSALRLAHEQALLLPVAVLPIRTPTSQDAQDNAAVTLRDRLHPGTTDRSGVTTYLVGQSALWAALEEASQEDLARGEKIGVPIVLAILFAVFGGLAAASLPLLLGAACVVISGAGIYLLSTVTPVSIFAPDIASMLGIGIAVDYSLFMLARYQRELRRSVAQEEALTTTMRTSGYAIVVSGVTVLVSLAGLFLVNSTVVRSMAAGAMSVVVMAVAGALTLTPVLMCRFGNRYAAQERPLVRAFDALVRRRRGRQSPSEQDAGSWWEWWARQVMARPVAALLGVIGVLVALALPALSMKVSDGALNQLPPHSDVRRATAILTESFGPGVTGPVQVLVTVRDGGTAASREEAVQRVSAILKLHPQLKAPSRYLSASGREVLLSATARLSPDGPVIHRVVDEIRSELAHARLPHADAVVGGTTAETEDYTENINASLWKVALFIAVATLILLVFFLRSIVLPLKAVLMTALTVAASYGVLVVIFQWRWFDSLVSVGGPGYLGSLTPCFVLSITFGLSMDYQVFLLTRMRELWREGASNAEAVERGLAASASVISSAAFIMVAVFVVFASVGVPSVREIGLGMAVAIALDATLVRLVLVPAAMRLLGTRNWWFPGNPARPVPAETVRRAAELRGGI
jgi:uncharacterized membrane protein YdfJ with MMPL/SSD domain